MTFCLFLIQCICTKCASTGLQIVCVALLIFLIIAFIVYHLFFPIKEREAIYYQYSKFKARKLCNTKCMFLLWVCDVNKKNLSCLLSDHHHYNIIIISINKYIMYICISMKEYWNHSILFYLWSRHCIQIVITCGQCCVWFAFTTWWFSIVSFCIGSG